MKKRGRRRSDGYTDGQMAKAHAIALLILCIAVVGVLLLLSGCRAGKRLTQMHTASIRQGVEVVRDSTYHPYTYKVSRFYDLPTGSVEREVLEGSGEVVRVVQSVRDTVEVVVRDTITEVVEKPIYIGSGSAGGGGNRNWYWWLLSGAVLAGAVCLFVRVRRYGKW